MSKLERRILWGCLLGVVIYAGIGLATDARELWANMRRFPLGVFAAALGLTLVNYSMRFAKWHFYLRVLELRVPVGESFNIFLAGLVMSVTPGKLGEVLKSLLLRESRGIAAARTAPIVVAERITDLLGLFVLASAGVGIFSYGRWAFWISLGVVAGLVALLGRRRLVRRILAALEHLPWVGGLHDKLLEAYESMASLLRWRPLAAATLLSALSWSMEVLAFLMILEALEGQGVTLLGSAFIFSITTILGAISFLPGGLGVAEGSMIGALLLHGVFTVEARAATATYLIRFATLWFGVVVGFLALLVFRYRHGDVDLDRESLDDEPPDVRRGEGASRDPNGG